ncbi:hypothetical protein [Synechococcus sp. N19]|uniref:hypothetical protein n=1 Tax=Synechococcus sp. N19 TaxID=2575512 RepID=UPI0010BE5374|nr:hypothetical protein [Synechococcus sp. N19]
MVDINEIRKIEKEGAQHFYNDLVSQYRLRGFGYSDTSIADKSVGYYKLRHSIGLTAGGEWRKYLRTTPNTEFNSLESKRDPLSNKIFFQLKDVGWANFDINKDMLNRVLQRDEKLQASEHSELASSVSYEFLKLIPPSVLRAIKKYLGTNKVWICTPDILHSKPYTRVPTRRELSDQAFLFHRDIDSTEAVKIFINLSTSEGGNHEYFQRSNYTDKREIMCDYDERFTDFVTEFDAKTIYETHFHQGRFRAKSLEKIYGKESLIKMPTSKGTAWVEDTYGLHRGTPCIDGERKVLSISFLKHPIRI